MRPGSSAPGDTLHIMGVEAVEILADIHARAFAENPEKSWRDKDFRELFVMPGTVAHLLCEQRDPDEEARPMGFVLSRTVMDEAEILTLAVLPDDRRRGVGQKLLTGLDAHLRARQVRYLYLEVRAGNDAARRLYLKAGFDPRGRRKGYYALKDGAREDAVVMLRRL